MKSVTILLLLILLTVAVIPSVHVYADGPWTYEFLDGDGPLPDEMINLEYGSYSEADDWYEGTLHVVAGGGDTDFLDVLLYIDFPTIVNITRVKMTIETAGTDSDSPPGPNPNDAWGSINKTAPNFLTFDSKIGPDVHALTTSNLDSGILSTTASQLLLRATVRIPDGNTAGAVARIVRIEIAGSGFDPFGGLEPLTLVRPLQQSDEHELGVYESQSENENTEYTVFVTSTAPSAPVLSAIAGRVDVVEQLTSSQCQERLQTSDVLPDTPLIQCVIEQYGDSTSYHTFTGLNSIYRVVIADDENGLNFEYFVANAPQYIAVGDDIHAGCILGETASIRPFFGGPANVEGVAVLTMLDDDTGEPVEVLNALSVYSVATNACNADPVYSSCYGDATLSQPQQWVTTGNVSWNNPGATLASNSSIKTTMALNPALESVMTVGARVISWNGGTANLRLQMGQMIINHPITGPTGVESYEIPLDIYEPDNAGMYTVSVSTSGAFVVELSYACITQGTIAPRPQSSCYFQNPSFDFGLTGWTTSGDVEAVPGAVVIGLGGSIEQNVTLFPETDLTSREYLVTVRYQGYFTDNPDYNSVEYTMQYAWPDSTPVNLPAGELTDDETAALIVDQFTLDVATEQTGQFVLAPAIIGGNSTFIGVRVFEVCISGPFPQQGGTFGPPRISTCDVVSLPQGENISDWLQYHWQNLERFYKCDMMVLLERMYSAVDQMAKTAGWAVRYWLALLYGSSDWLSQQFFPWLTGYLDNMAQDPGFTGTIPIGGGDEPCNNLFCALDSLFSNVRGIFDIIGRVASDIIGFFQSTFDFVAYLLSTVINAVVFIGLELVTRIFSLIDFVMSLLQSLITSYNTATPTALPGMPNCSVDPQSNAICQGIWVLDNTIFTPGTPGALIIPLIVSVGSLYLLLWAVGEVKKTIVNAGMVS